MALHHHQQQDHTNSQATPDPAIHTRAGGVWEEQDRLMHTQDRVPDGILYTSANLRYRGWKQSVSRIRHDFVSSCFVALFDIVLVVVILSTNIKSRIDFLTFVYRLNK